MSFLAREYEIPFLGKVKLIEATGYDESFNGSYYAKNKQLGKFIKNCKTLEELQNKVINEIRGYFDQQKTISELIIKSENEKLSELENNILDLDEEIKKNSLEWLQQYQTKNPLQLDLQEKRKIEF